MFTDNNLFVEVVYSSQNGGEHSTNGCWFNEVKQPEHTLFTLCDEGVVVPSLTVKITKEFSVEIVVSGGNYQVTPPDRALSNRVEEDGKIINHITFSAKCGDKVLFSQNGEEFCVIHFRAPRRLLVCTGAPLSSHNDKVIATMIEEFTDDIIISGGSTALMVSRELNRELVMVKRRDNSGLPPTYAMDGVKFVTEGIITLGRVKCLLERLDSDRAEGDGVDALLVNELLSHDTIIFVVGTKINKRHQNFNIPIHLGFRRSVVKCIAEILENKYSKSTELIYF